MAELIYRKHPNGRGYVEVKATDGEKLSEGEALILALQDISAGIDWLSGKITELQR